MKKTILRIFFCLFIYVIAYFHGMNNYQDNIDRITTNAHLEDNGEIQKIAADLFEKQFHSTSKDDCYSRETVKQIYVSGIEIGMEIKKEKY